MTRPESHRIDERAKRVFESSLPDAWVVRAQNPDYRIDYSVEIFDGDTSSGLFWNAQLKGTKRPKYLKSTPDLAYSMEVEHVAYYLDKVRLPVFLVLVDTVSRAGWWLFLQQYAKESLPVNWRSRTLVNIRIPRCHSLEDVGSFRSAIDQATKYMCDLYPSSVQTSIIAEKRRLEALDPRFEVDISANSESVQWFLKPKSEDVHFKLQIKGEQAVAKARDLVEAGGKVDFSVGEVSISGMAEGWTSGQGPIALESFRTAPVTIRLSAIDGVQRRTESVDLLGELRGGSKRARLQCQLSGALISASTQLDVDRSQVDVQFKFDLAQWIGQDVRYLPNLDTVLPFCEVLASDAPGEDSIEMQIGVFIQGNNVSRMRANRAFAEEFVPFAQLANTLARGREVARALNIDARVPEDITPQQAREILFAHKLITTGAVSSDSPGATVMIRLAEDEYQKMPASVKSPGQQLSVMHDGELPFLSTTINLGPLEVTMSAVTLDDAKSTAIEPGVREITYVAERHCATEWRRQIDTKAPENQEKSVGNAAEGLHGS